MGSAIVGFDYQVFRATKPPPELVEQGKPIAPVPAADGGRISIDLPERPGGPDDATATPTGRPAPTLPTRDDRLADRSGPSGPTRPR